MKAQAVNDNRGWTATDTNGNKATATFDEGADKAIERCGSSAIYFDGRPLDLEALSFESSYQLKMLNAGRLQRSRLMEKRY